MFMATSVAEAVDATVAEAPYIVDTVSRFRRAVTHAFVYYGGTEDYVESPFAAGLTVRDYTARRLAGNFQVVATIDPSNGIRFLQDSMRDKWDEWAGAGQTAQAQNPVAARLAAGAGQSGPAKRDLPRAPRAMIDEAIKVLRTAREETISDRKTRGVLVILDRVDIFLKGDPSVWTDDRLAMLHALHAIGTDPDVRKRGNMLVMLAPDLPMVPDEIRNASAGTNALEIPLPERVTRKAYINRRCQSENWQMEMDADALANFTAGLYLRHIEDIRCASLTEDGNVRITWDIARQVKREKIAAEYADVLEIVEPTAGLDGHGGHTEVKDWYRVRFVEPALAGKKAILPLGILHLGSPGTGKTDIAARLAFDTKYNFIVWKASKVKGQFVGQSEALLDKLLRAVIALAPCIVLIDEIDQSFARGSGSGSGGDAVEANQFKRVLEFVGDESHRGDVVVIGNSNRPDILDSALRRSGRFDWKVPLLVPQSADERCGVLRALWERKQFAADDESLTAASADTLTGGFSQAELQSVVVEAMALVETLRMSPSEALTEASETLVREDSASNKLMERLAIQFCSNRKLLPEQFRNMSTESLSKEVTALGERAASEMRTFEL
jgi:transitional endoplasmic reticulum ATPase